MTDKNSQSARDAGTMTALLGLAAVSLLLVFLVAMVMPQILGIVLVVGLFLGAVALHYVVWGWWLGTVLKMDDTEISEESSLSSKMEQPSSADL